MHTLGAAAQLTGSLRAAEQQVTNYSGFAAVEIEPFLKAMLVLGDAAIRRADGSRQRIVLQRAQRLADGALIESHDRIAVGLLVAGVDHGVQGKRIVLRSGDLLFEEHP